MKSKVIIRYNSCRDARARVICDAEETRCARAVTCASSRITRSDPDDDDEDEVHSQINDQFGLLVYNCFTDIHH